MGWSVGIEMLVSSWLELGNMGFERSNKEALRSVQGVWRVLERMKRKR